MSWIRALAWADDGRLAVGRETGRVSVSEAVLWEHESFVSALAWSPSGELAAGWMDGLVRVGDRELRVEGGVSCLTWCGDSLVVGTGRGGVAVLEGPSGFALRGHVSGLCSLGPTRVAACSPLEEGVLLWDFAEPSVAWWPCPRARCLTVVEGGFVAGTSRGTLRWADSEVSLGGSPVLCLAACSGGPVAGSQDGGVRLVLGGESRELGRHAGEVTAVACCGDEVASGGQDGVLRRWHL